MDIINDVDEFIIYDDVQYTRRDWRNRNRIKTANGTMWLTIPIDVKGKYDQLINQANVKNFDWAQLHLKNIEQSYKKAPYFDLYFNKIIDTYEIISSEKSLLKIDIITLEMLCDLLSINTKISLASEYKSAGQKQDRLISLCKASNATHYLSGPAAKNYIDPKGFSDSGLILEYANYDGYPEYTQLHGDFDHYVSVLDLLFMTGDKAREYMLSDKRRMGFPPEISK
jgi:hypothetical protein